GVADRVLETRPHRHGTGLRSYPILQLLRIERLAVAAPHYERFHAAQCAIREAYPRTQFPPVLPGQLLRKSGVLVADQIAAKAPQRAENRGRTHPELDEVFGLRAGH